jgi:hypothetical protein
MDDPNPPGYGHRPSSGFGHPLSSGFGHPLSSGHPRSQAERGRIVPCKDGSQRHQLDQKRLQEFYPFIPGALTGKELYMLHPVRYMPPHGDFYDIHDRERVQFPYTTIRQSCKVCMDEQHVEGEMLCHEMCLGCGQTHPTVVSESSCLLYIHSLTPAAMPTDIQHGPVMEKIRMVAG